MAKIFKHPDLTDYFVDVPDVAADTPLDNIPSIVEAFEAGKVIYLSKLKFGIDYQLWADLATDKYPGLKKFKSSLTPGQRDDSTLHGRVQQAGVPEEVGTPLENEIRRLYSTILPRYEKLFHGYRFIRGGVVWRLNTIMNENMHIDCYRIPPPAHHFARMFINLDTAPRIWQTSYTINEMSDKFGAKLRDQAKGMDPEQFRRALNASTFGDSPNALDLNPRHVIYFEPGDVWIVDSRQVSHQIFYGRRAVSFDFLVDVASMRSPEKFYLANASKIQNELLAAA